MNTPAFRCRSRWGIAVLALTALLGARMAAVAAPPASGVPVGASSVPTYTIYDVTTGLPPGAGVDEVTAAGLNNFGSVVGRIALDGQDYAFVSNTSIELLGEGPAGFFVGATGINDAGLIVGNHGDFGAVKWDPGNYGTLQPLPIGSGEWVDSWAAAVSNVNVNSTGVIAGSVTQGSDYTSRPAWWVGSQGPAVVTLLNEDDAFTAVNTGAGNPLHVTSVGYRTLAGDGTTRGLKLKGEWPTGTWSLLTVPGNVPAASSLETAAFGVNDSSRVVGTKVLPNGQTRAVKWAADGTPTDLPPLPGDVECTARDINNHNRAVGQSVTAGGLSRAVVWFGNQVVDLNTKLPPDSAWILNTATAINDEGQICGNGTYQGHVAAFRLDPHEPPIPPFELKWELLLVDNGPAVKLTFEDRSTTEQGFELKGTAQVPGQDAKPVRKSFPGHEGMGMAEILFPIEVGKRYRLALSGFNEAGMSEPSNTVSFGIMAPPAPTDPQVGPGAPPQTSLRLSWAGSEQDSGYRIRWRTLPGGTFGEAVIKGRERGDRTRCTASGLSAGTTYEFQIVAFSLFDGHGRVVPIGDLNGDGLPFALSSPLKVKGTTAVAAPDAPQGVSAAIVSGGIRVKWSAVPRAQSYRVFRDDKTAPLAGPTATQFVDSALKPAFTYTYWVRAVNAGGESPNSEPVSMQSNPVAPGVTITTARGSFSRTLRDTNASEGGYEWKLTVSPANAVPAATPLSGTVAGKPGTGTAFPVGSSVGTTKNCTVTFKARAFIVRDGRNVYSDYASQQAAVAR